MYVALFKLTLPKKVDVSSDLKLSCRCTFIWKYDYTIVHRVKSMKIILSNSTFLVFVTRGQFSWFYTIC